jgi:hypothetical protein
MQIPSTINSELIWPESKPSPTPGGIVATEGISFGCVADRWLRHILQILVLKVI